jgi:hypothetical protein
MRVHPRFAAIKGIRVHEWVLRFLFGGAVCVLAGLVAKRYGPVIGGLFLAFPAIFPASATLLEAHERTHKARAGFDGTLRGRTVASIDAAGTALGCAGLAGFAIVCWLLLVRLEAAAVFAIATLAWCVLSVAAWRLRKSRLLRFHHAPRHPGRAFRSP